MVLNGLYGEYKFMAHQAFTPILITSAGQRLQQDIVLCKMLYLQNIARMQS